VFHVIESHCAYDCCDVSKCWDENFLQAAYSAGGLQTYMNSEPQILGGISALCVVWDTAQVPFHDPLDEFFHRHATCRATPVLKTIALILHVHYHHCDCGLLADDRTTVVVVAAKMLNDPQMMKVSMLPHFQNH